jgi:anti-sigma B factor antagonist
MKRKNDQSDQKGVRMTTATRNRFRLEVERNGPAAVVRIRGTAGTEEAPDLQEKLEELTFQRVPVIVLDLGAMDFISSMGLGAIIAGHLRARKYQGEIRLASPSPAVAQLLETTRLTQLFGIYPTVQEALQSSRISA